MDELVFARVLHVLGVVVWIGGVAMVTLVLLPSLSQIQSPIEAMEIFKRIRRRFAAYARYATLLVGLSGFYMTDALNAWERFTQWQYWWMHLMVLIWLFFSVMLFIMEPRSRRNQSINSNEKNITPEALNSIQRKHLFLLLLGFLTIAGAVAGSHGWSISGR
jgi:uncharacterized membrane protein